MNIPGDNNEPMIVIGSGPNCDEFYSAWRDEIIRKQPCALAEHIEKCQICREWDRVMKEGSKCNR